MNAPRGSITITVGLGIIAVVMLALGAGMFFFWRHHDSQPASAEAALIEFEQVRARFKGQRPLLDMQKRQAARVAQVAGAAVPLHSFHTLIFDTRGDQRLVHLTMPYWLVRLRSRRHREFRWLGEMTFLDDTEFDAEAIHVSLDEIERNGPGLLVDYQHSTGGQFIAWVE